MSHTPSEFRLDDQVALITGGGSGIGRSIAEAYVAHGARVAVVGRRSDRLADTQKHLGPENVLPIVADITRDDDRARIVEECVDHFDRLDILVNNAGTARASSLKEVREIDWNELMALHVSGPLELSRHALVHLEASGGCVINISTGASLAPVPGFGVYGATKAALNYASQVLALEAAPAIRVNVICPGGVDTEIFEKFLPEDQVDATKDWFRTSTPLARIGSPSDVANAAVYLASPAASWVTGVVLRVDGGLNISSS